MFGEDSGKWGFTQELDIDHRRLIVLLSFKKKHFKLSQLGVDAQKMEDNFFHWWSWVVH